MERLAHQYYQDVYKFVLNHVGDKEDAEDVTQECFTRALVHRQNKGEHITNERAWLFGVAKHCISNLYRNKKRWAGEHPKKPTPSFLSQRESQEMDTLADRRDLETEIILRESLSLTTDEIEALSPKLREVALLAQQGYSPQEISQILQQPASTTRVYLARSRKSIGHHTT